MSRSFALEMDKLKAAIKVAVSACSSDELGAVKLHKVLYFADMINFLHKGSSITGAAYRKRPFGPTCDSALQALRELESSGEIEITDSDYFGYTKRVFNLTSEPDTNALGADELALIMDSVDFVCRNNTAKTISEFTHDRSWEMVEFGDVIPYHSALNLIPNVVSDEAVAWGEEIGRAFEAERQNQDTVGTSSYRDFRSRISQARA